MTEPTLSQDLWDVANYLRSIGYTSRAERIEAAIPVLEAALALAIDVLRRGDVEAVRIAHRHGLRDPETNDLLALGRQLLALKGTAHD